MEAAMNKDKKYEARFVGRPAMIAAMLAAFAGQASAAGCAELYRQMASGYAVEIATKSGDGSNVSARRFVKWRGWDLLTAGGLDPMMATQADIAWGKEVAGMEGHPEGSGACVALAMRMESSEAWSSAERSAANQKAVDELGALDWASAKSEVERQKAWSSAAR
jgi:hypothetical protein